MLSVRWVLISLGIAAAGLYLLLCGILFFYQRSLIYFPQPRSDRSSAVMTLKVEGETVQVSTRPYIGAKALVYFGGNAEDVSMDLPDLAHAFPDRAIYALHYPGYGGSSGSPTERGIFADALALFDTVHAEHPDVTVIGRSLGSGVAVWLASQKPVTRLVLVTPFDSLADAAQNQFPYLPVRLLLRDRFASSRYAPQVTAPTRIIVAGQDEIIPRSSSDRLSTRFRPNIASYTVVPNVGHNTIQNGQDYWTLLSAE